MTCHLGVIRSGMSEDVAIQRSTSRGSTYRERLIHRIPCPYCSVEIILGSMMKHWRLIHRTETMTDWNQLPLGLTEQLLHVFHVRFTKCTSQCQCPLSGCLGSSCNCNNLWNHFNWKHWGYILRILEEHPSPFPKCERCGSQVSPWRLNNRHYDSDKCRIGEHQQSQQDTLQNCFEASRVFISVKTYLMEPLAAFSTCTTQLHKITATGQPCNRILRRPDGGGEWWQSY